MKLTPDPYIVTASEIAWLVKAVLKDTIRPILRCGVIAHVEGFGMVIATTDTHRLHMIRLVSKCKPFESKVVDLQRIQMELRFVRGKEVQISNDLTEVLVGTTDHKHKDRTFFRPVYGPVFPEGVGNYPDFARVIPKPCLTPPALFVMNGRYMIDAMSILSGYDQGCAVTCEASNKPVVFEPRTEGRWKAVVMPMSLEGFDERKR